MTPAQKILITELSKGCYLRPWKSHGGTKCFRLYDLKGNPVRTIRTATVKRLDKYVKPKIKIWKKDRSGRITLNLSGVRQLHGKTILKKQYKKKLKS